MKARTVVELPHGYTMPEINKLSRIASSTAHTQISLADRYDDAWSTIIEALYNAAERPPEGHLVVMARNALYRGYYDMAHHHGIADRNPDNGYGSGRRFNKFWFQRATPSFEDDVVESIALEQIWPKLTRGQKEALVAFAIWGGHIAAAAATGVEHKNHVFQVGAGRKRFLQWWHQGETPTKKWGRDHPGNGGLGSYRSDGTGSAQTRSVDHV